MVTNLADQLSNHIRQIFIEKSLVFRKLTDSKLSELVHSLGQTNENTIIRN